MTSSTPLADPTALTARGCPEPAPATFPLLTQAEVDALWQGNTASWTGLIRQVEAAVHRKLSPSAL